jgi:hypothetical protein
MLRHRAAQTKSGTSGHAARTSSWQCSTEVEHTIPLRLSNNAVAMLTLEAQVREISLGQLVGMLIEAAMAQDLSRVLDKNPTDEPE